MPISRRAFSTAILAGVLTVPSVHAKDDPSGYPIRPVRLIVSYGAGGSLDAMTRILGTELSKSLGQAFVVENVAGAGGAIGVKRVINSPADGYTLLMGITSDVVLAPITNPTTARYQPSDLLAITQLGTTGVVLLARPDLEAGSLQELIQLAQRNPGKLSYGVPGAGSLPHVAMESLIKSAKLDIPAVPYKSASNITADVMGGQIDLAVVGLPAVLPLIETRKVKPIAVFSRHRDIGNKAIPAASETKGLEDIDFAIWTGMFAPKGTPATVAAKMQAAVARALKQPDLREQFEKLGVTIAPDLKPVEFSSFVAESDRQVRAAAKKSGLMP